MHHHLTRRSLLGLMPGLLISSAVAPPLATHARTVDASPAARSLSASLDEVLQAGVKRGLPGVTLCVEQAGKSIYSGAAGVASIEDRTPVGPTDRFRIYSITKTFTATIVLQLVDEGVLSLDDTVAQSLSDPVAALIPNVDRITLRQLLTHSSGIYDYMDEADSPFYEDAFLGANADWAKVWTPQELLAYADGAKHAPYFEPGQGVYYANTNYILLGLIIEAATNRSFDDELRDRILAPLALEDTSIEVGATLPDDMVDGYQVVEGEAVSVSALNLTWAWAAGGMVSTTADLARFARATFAGELVSAAAFKEMFTIVPGTWGGLEFGMGIFRVQTPDGEVVGMSGGSAGGNSTMTLLREADVTVIVLSNLYPDDGATDTIRDAAMEVVLNAA